MTRSQSDAAPRAKGPKGRGKPRAEPGLGEGAAGAAQVVRYLREHPDFLCDHPELLSVLDLPGRSNGAGVIDFQQVMVERLRGEVAEITRLRDELVQTGRNNLQAQSRVHQATLALMRAGSFEQLIEIVTVDLAVMLDLDVVTLAVERTDHELPPVRVGGLC